MATKYIVRRINVKVPYTPGDPESMKEAAEYVQCLEAFIERDGEGEEYPAKPPGTQIEFVTPGKRDAE